MEVQSKSKPENPQVALIILNAITHLQVGKIKLAQFLKGSLSKDVIPISQHQIYGGLMWYTISTIEGFIEQLEDMGLIKKIKIPGKFDFYILELTDAGKLVLEKKEEIALQIIIIKEPVKVGPSEIETLRLFSQGKNISEIARERNLVESTIYSHFYRLIATNKMSSSEIISEDKKEKILSAAKTLKEPTVKKVKELLPEMSYDEIRCVLADIERNEKENFS